MKLPEKFSVRIAEFPGLTHTVKRNDLGYYKVRWSRGFFEALIAAGKKVDTFKNRVVDEDHMQAWLEAGTLVFVDDKSKHQKQEEIRSASLPDVLHFHCNNPKEVYKATKSGERYHVTWDFDETGRKGTYYEVNTLINCIRTSLWTLIDIIPLSGEQLRANKEIREQVSALNQSIKLNEADIEHKERLIASYLQRKQDLLNKIVED